MTTRWMFQGFCSTAVQSEQPNWEKKSLTKTRAVWQVQLAAACKVRQMRTRILNHDTTAAVFDRSPDPDVKTKEMFCHLDCHIFCPRYDMTSVKNAIIILCCTCGSFVFFIRLRCDRCGLLSQWILINLVLFLWLCLHDLSQLCFW